MQKLGRLVPREAYLGAPDGVAQDLLGKLLVREVNGAVLAGRIVETEAYFGRDDPAAHAFAGRTARTEVLFGAPGCAYVYFIYGMHACLNVSCEPEGEAGCVLIRGLEPVAGMAMMATNRGLSTEAGADRLTAGPGRLCQAMGITRAGHNGMDLTKSGSELQIREDGFVPAAVTVTRRIGIRKAADRPLRFYLEGFRGVSRVRPSR